MEVTWETKAVLKEWGAFCQKLKTDVSRYDAGEKFLESREAGGDHSKELDLALRLTFEPPVDGMPPDIFAETPPVLEKLLLSRISDADALLQAILQKDGGTTMDDIILEKKIWQEWDKFRNRIFSPVERQKEWMHTPAKWSDLPEREKCRLHELNAFVQRILDSNEECIPEILDEYPTELKLLLMFRLQRAGDFLKNMLYPYGAIKAPAGSDPVKALQDLFRELLLQP